MKMCTFFASRHVLEEKRCGSFYIIILLHHAESVTHAFVLLSLSAVSVVFDNAEATAAS